MTREHLRFAALVGLVVAACATSQGPDASDRLASIEERLARLEAQSRPDAATESDASPPQTDDRGRYRIPPPHFFPDAAGDAMGQCFENAEHYCAETAERVTPRAADAGFSWTKEDALPPPASASPAGRECLERARRDCLAWKDWKPGRSERNELYEWLDAQLVPPNLDQAYTGRVRSKIAKATGKAASSIDLECTKQFCRFGKIQGYADAGGGDPGTMGLMRFMDDAAQGMGDESHLYVVREGYRVR